MKTLATLTAASIVALAGASALAQTAAPTPAAPPAATAPAPERGPRGPGMSRADFDALTDARMAAVQAGLKLNPEQQRLWGPVEEALRAQAAERADRFEERRRMMSERRDDRGQPDPSLDITQRLERRAEEATRRAQRATEQAQRMTALSNAMKPFYGSFDDNQKRLLPVLLSRGRGGERRMGMYRHHDYDHGWMDRGRGGPGMMDRGRGMDRGWMMDRERGMMGRGGMMERGPQRYQ
jgi:zinc resistance-associated protein